MARRWNQENLDELKARSAGTSVEDLAKQFKSTPVTIRKKLKELGVGDDEPERGVYEDPLVDSYGEAVKAMYSGKWQKAADLLRQVIDGVDMVEVAERARQMLNVCEHHLGSGAGDDIDPFLQAVYAKNRGDFDTAAELCQDKKNQEDERFIYLSASLHALQARPEEAATELTKAIEMNPKNRVYAFHDPDFEALRQEQEYAGVFGLE